MGKTTECITAKRELEQVQNDLLKIQPQFLKLNTEFAQLKVLLTEKEQERKLSEDLVDTYR
eukprot:Pgem_evm1s16080